MTDGPAYDDPRTLAGQLQRGRGLGARRAPAHPGAADLVYACVVTDRRWDQQTEERGSYLARLVHRMDLPLAPLERHLFGGGGPEDVEPALRVLAPLPLTGRLDAVDLLRRYALQGLLGCAPEAAEGYAVEALDDCEPAVQEAACAVVPDTAYVRARLRTLGCDPLAPEVHDAARRALGGLPAR